MLDELRNQAGEDPSPSADNPKIPKAVIKRLSLYTRVLQKFSMSGIEKISSKELGDALGLNSAQVRKDLAYFGQFGVPGLGYYVEELRTRIKSILGTDRTVRLALVGVGNLGQALLSYTTQFQRDGFRVVVAFDADKRKVGGERMGVPVFHVSDMGRHLKEMAIDIVMLTVPAGVAQQVTDLAIQAGITAILNFVPERLLVPEHVKVHYVDLSIEIESLSYYLK
ncbi:MAG TPA: redox-sensing transcriptional repressor Rex [Candidatus Sumerlaeota bacterium]|nr:MAG: Redox-sensing transcriptional repressor Rex [candidate division BRC1 bacterium ADurb.BinA292]HOE97495.1 redox-sensing transcriptional repressor Rex [Candidatus Sumerlaeota bacterium]HOR28685.1 redox-sensing transcriptional repressor Rex [Candidatus Sumerlaeota bacterium]HPK04038.1 redox-sensing transcriptional repressor Rex [Candidatus Sumerlaeota bacterium]